MCKTVKTKYARSPELPCQQLLKHHLFAVSLAPADADYQHEVNGHFLYLKPIRNKDSRDFMIFSNWFILKHRNWPLDKNFRKLYEW